MRLCAGASLALAVGACSSDSNNSGGAGAAGGSGGEGGSTAGSGGTGGAAGSAGTAGSGGSAGGGTMAIYELPDDLSALADDTFFNHPWPSDFRFEADGSVRFEGYPNPKAIPLMESYKEALVGLLDGFSPVASGFVRFTGPLDPATLPSGPEEARQADSTVQLIDVDANSPERGTRKLITLEWRRDAGVYWADNTLAFMPTLGFPLRPSTQYAFVVTNGVTAEDGGDVQPNAELRQVLGLDEPDDSTTTTLRDDLATAVSEVEASGVAASDIVQLAVFTTNDPAAETAAIRDWVVDNYTAPTAKDWTAEDDNAAYDIYEGNYGPSPDFQRGNLPFISADDGGELAFDDQGVPELQREFDLRFSLAVPDETACPMPTDGYPIVLYAHGTGGNYRSYRSVADTLSAQCLAVMGIDQIFHGTRPGADQGTQEILFFNVENLQAARANGPQSAIDVVQQARLFTESQVVVPAAVSRTGADIAFDPTKVTFFGHSQGGLNGPLFLAVDDQTRGGVLSGAGGIISITLLEKTKPDPSVANLVKVLLGLITPVEAEELTFLHPAISLVQSIVDPTDPINYVAGVVREPRGGASAKSILMTEGVNPDFSGDNYTPPHGTEVLAIHMGLPPMNPVIHTPLELGFSDLSPVTIPMGGLSGNLANGQASGVLAQWPASEASDGHFVVFQISEAEEQAAAFLRNLSDDPVGNVPVP